MKVEVGKTYVYVGYNDFSIFTILEVDFLGMVKFHRIFSNNKKDIGEIDTMPVRMAIEAGAVLAEEIKDPQRVIRKVFTL